MKKVKFLLAAIICMLLSVSVLAQMPAYQGCEAATKVTVHYKMCPSMPHHPPPSVLEVIVEWKFKEDPSWTVQNRQQQIPDFSSENHFTFSIPVCEKEIASMSIKVYRAPDPTGAQFFLPVLLDSQLYKGHTPEANFSVCFY